MVTTQTTTYPQKLQELLTLVEHMNPSDINLIEHAYHYSESAHAGQRRKSGEDYFIHPVAVATILAGLHLDAEAIAAGLLHDVIEDNDGITYDDVVSEFGKVIADLVDGVTKLTQLPIEQIGLKSDKKATATKVNREMEYFRKMILAMDNDVRVILVKLADRLHNMRTLHFMPTDKQERTARETMDLFAPLANRLGIWQIKWELEDLSFRYINPEAYRGIARKLDEKRQDREAYVTKVAELIRANLEENGVHGAVITARPKHIYSIYKKMQRKDVPLEKIYDVRAIRVIVQQKKQCYLVLGAIHDLFIPIPGEFDDYIAAPKESSYQSLHTAVLDSQGKTIEVQIRTHEMHEQAEYGIAAHWRYKEGRASNSDKDFEDRIAFLRRSMDVHFGDEDAESFMNRMIAEALKERVYVFTPRADIIDLPIGSTPVDFAYSIHTDVGHRCRGAKIHGKLEPLNYVLKIGDQVEIVIAKRGGPSMDWLNEDLGYTKTARARSKIKHWFRKQNRDQHITLGRATLEREMRRLGVFDKLSFEAVSQLLGFSKLEDFFAAIGVGDINGSQITQRVLEDERRRADTDENHRERLQSRRARRKPDTANGIQIMGVSGMLTNIATCCSPVVGDDIIGFITRGRGVTIHRTDCTNVANIKDVERLINVSWGGSTDEYTYIVPVEIVAQDREGLLRDITTMIAAERINIASVAVKTRQQIAILSINLEITNNQQLGRILTKIETIENIYEAHRVNQNM
ncbi:MAG: bifunctional (p)ppGpp synthetase/guanosine-3',5'-bis(diphosphate) 3'-pyrophosphohydrolase [Phototrophicaceae bacterium]